MSGCCEAPQFDGQNETYKRVLLAVIGLNATMFAVEAFMGAEALSIALWADALDFAADAATYGLSLAVIGMSLTVRAKASLVKGISLSIMAVLVLCFALNRAFSSEVPEAIPMGLTAIAAFGVNLASVLLLVRFRDGDSNIRSVWLCSRNDMIGNGLVLLAAVGVFGTQTRWPDLVVASLMAALFLQSSISIIRQARTELKQNLLSQEDQESVINGHFH